MRTFERVVLVIASGITMIGAIAVVWRELTAPGDNPRGGRVRRLIEVLLPAAGLVGLLIWLWVR